MKPSFFSAVVLILVSVVACNKNAAEPDPPVKVDSILSKLPKRAIITDGFFDSQHPTVEVINIEYDTLNRKIDLYLDDTSTANPHDEVYGIYQYNRDGYLLYHKRKFQDGEVSYLIERTADNKLSSMVFTQLGSTRKDTVYFSYRDSSGYTICTSEFFPNSPGSRIWARYYDANLKLHLYQNIEEGFRQDYEYNANGSLKKISSVGHGESNQSTVFYYNSRLKDDSADLVKQVFMGKDYHMEELEELYCFGILFNQFSISLTSLYHLTKRETTVVYSTSIGIHTSDLEYVADVQNHSSTVSIHQEGKKRYKLELFY